MELRDYQVEAIKAARREIAGGKRRIVISAPTGAGKTEIAMEIIRGAVRKGKRASFIADRRALVHQTSDRFTAAGIQHGVLMADDTRGVLEPVRVESAQTIQSRGLRGGTDLCVIDECHEVRPELVRLIAESGAVLIGLTATPFPARLADPIDAHRSTRAPGAPPRYEGLVATTTTERLIADGWLCPFDVVAPEAVIDTEGVPVQGGEFRSKDLSKRVMRIVGDIVPTWEEQIKTRYGGVVQPTIVFGASVDDSIAIAALFRRAGYSTHVVSSREDDEKNQDIINSFRDGEFDVLVNCAMLSRGADFPRATILCDCYPMRKILTPIQRYGRICRTFPGKERALVIDFAENWLYMRSRILQFYTSGPVWPPRQAGSRSERDDTPPRDTICQHCRTVLPPGDQECPSCGASKPTRSYGGKGWSLERVEGRLVLLDSVSGETAVYGGELWREVCTVTQEKFPHDPARAKKRAFASYRSITGNWPEFRAFMPHTDRSADPAVEALMDRNFRAWLAEREAARRL